MAYRFWQPKDRARRRRGKRPRPPDADGPALLYGWHTVKAALENPARRFHRLLATENALRRLADDGVTLPIKPQLARPAVIEARLGPDAAHQGLLAEVDPLPAPAITELAPDGIVLVLDQITDPHNVGAILRSAAAFAAKAIITTARHSPEATGVLAKSASGALELVPLVTVRNLARGLAELRTRGFLLVGLDSGGVVGLDGITLRGPATHFVSNEEGVNRPVVECFVQSQRSVYQRLYLGHVGDEVGAVLERRAAVVALALARHEAQPPVLPAQDAGQGAIHCPPRRFVLAPSLDYILMEGCDIARRAGFIEVLDVARTDVLRAAANLRLAPVTDRRVGLQTVKLAREPVVGVVAQPLALMCGSGSQVPSSEQPVRSTSIGCALPGICSSTALTGAGRPRSSCSLA